MPKESKNVVIEPVVEGDGIEAKYTELMNKKTELFRKLDAAKNKLSQVEQLDQNESSLKDDFNRSYFEDLKLDTQTNSDNAIQFLEDQIQGIQLKLQFKKAETAQKIQRIKDGVKQQLEREKERLEATSNARISHLTEILERENIKAQQSIVNIQQKLSLSKRNKEAKMQTYAKRVTWYESKRSKAPVVRKAEAEAEALRKELEATTKLMDMINANSSYTKARDEAVQARQIADDTKSDDDKSVYSEQTEYRMPLYVEGEEDRMVTLTEYEIITSELKEKGLRQNRLTAEWELPQQGEKYYNN